MIVISIGILQINPQVWLDLNSPIRFFSRYRMALELKSLGEFMKVDHFDSSHLNHPNQQGVSRGVRIHSLCRHFGKVAVFDRPK